jgi:hypothetical protein
MVATWKKLLLVPLAASFMLAGCMESKEEIARKPDVVAQMVENSASICEKGPVNGTDAQYKERLTEVLSRARTVQLEALQKNGITVCLDQRLDHQKSGFWDGPSHSVFYNNGKGGGVAAIYDNGTQPKDASFWKGDAYDWGGVAVDYLGDMAKNGKITAESGNWHGYTYTISTGKSSSTHYGWAKTDKFNEGAETKNPQLTHPPLVKPAAQKPAS